MAEWRGAQGGGRGARRTTDAAAGAPRAFAAELSTPRAAGLAGIAFALLVTVAILLWRSAIPDGADPSWSAEPSSRRSVAVALQLIPFAGIAFLWFIGVIRTRLGDREDKLFATVFLGSGLLFVATLFTAAALMGGLLALHDGSRTVAADDVRLVSALSTTLLSTFSIRMAAVFTVVVTNLGRRTGIVPRWLVAIGYGSALVLLLAPPMTLWATMLFPLWVLLLSLSILFSARHEPRR